MKNAQSLSPISLRVFESPNGKVFWVAMKGEQRAGAGIGNGPVESFVQSAKKNFPNIAEVQPMDVDFMLEHFPPQLMTSCPVMGPRADEARERQKVASKTAGKMPYGYWVKPDGQAIEVPDESLHIEEYCKQTGGSDCWDYDDAEDYTEPYGQGWVRIQSEYGLNVSYDGQPAITPSQATTISQIAAMSDLPEVFMELHGQYAKVPNKPPLIRATLLGQRPLQNAQPTATLGCNWYKGLKLALLVH